MFLVLLPGIICLLFLLSSFILFFFLVGVLHGWGGRLQDKEISRAQRRLEEGGQGAMAMDTAAVLRINEEIEALEAQASTIRCVRGNLFFCAVDGVEYTPNSTRGCVCSVCVNDDF